MYIPLYVLLFIVVFFISFIITLKIKISVPHKLLKVTGNEKIGKIYKNMEYENNAYVKAPSWVCGKRMSDYR